MVCGLDLKPISMLVFQYKPAYTKSSVENLKSGSLITQTHSPQKYSKFKETLNNWLGLIRRNSTKPASLLVSILVLVVGLVIVRQQQRLVGRASVLGSCPTIQKEECLNPLLNIIFFTAIGKIPC